MTAQQIVDLSRFLTNTNNVTTPDTSLLASLNERAKQMIVRLSKLKEDFNITKVSSNLVSGTEAYALASDLIRIKRVEIQWETGGKWYPVDFVDMNELETTQDTTAIGDNFNQSKPFADVYGTNIYLRPIPDANVTDGLAIWYVHEPVKMTALSETPDVPAFIHRLLADLLVIDIRQMKGEISGTQGLQEESIIWEFLKNQVSPRVNDQGLIAKPLREDYE